MEALPDGPGLQLSDTPEPLLSLPFAVLETLEVRLVTGIDLLVRPTGPVTLVDRSAGEAGGHRQPWARPWRGGTAAAW